MDNNKVSITLEFTPNPNTLKFVVNRSLVERGAVNFLKKEETEKAPLAKKLFDVPGVTGVMVGSNFVTITKGDFGSWDVLAEEVPKVIEITLNNGGPFDADFQFQKPPTGNESEVEIKVKEILDKEIRPAVAMDGGDITFAKYEDGVVYLYLQGACSSCPSSIATLKMGVEARLKEVVPEIKEVVQI